MDSPVGEAAPISGHSHAWAGIVLSRNRTPVWEPIRGGDGVAYLYLVRGDAGVLHSSGLLALRGPALVMLWSGRPWQLVYGSADAQAHEVSIPLARFLSWKLPADVMERLYWGRELRPLMTPPVLALEGHLAQWCGDLASEDPFRERAVLLELGAWSFRTALAMGDASVTARVLPDGGWAAGYEKAAELARFIRDHSTEAITVPDAADAVGLHPNYAVRMFQKRTGSTLIAYLAAQRLAHAQMLLATTGDAVTEIGYQAGYGSPSRFFAAFKAGCGVSPAEYRSRVWSLGSGAQ